MSDQAITNGGIYKILSRATGMFYIGSTYSFRKRKADHWGLLTSGTHYNSKLSNLVIEHGLEDLDFIELEVFNGSRFDLYNIEQRYIDELRPQLNISLIVGTPAMQATPVLQYDVHGKFVARYESAGYAAVELGIVPVGIYKYLRDQKWLAGGYMWRWQESEDLPDTIPPFEFETSKGGSGNWRRFWNNSEYTVYQWDLEGNLVKEWPNKELIVEELGCYKRSLDDHIHGQRGSLFGYVFSMSSTFPGYVNRMGEYNASGIRLIPSGNDLPQEILKFKSGSEAGRYFGVKGEYIIKACKSKKTWNGYSVVFGEYLNKRDREIIMAPARGDVLEFPSINEAGRHFNVSESGISKAINNGSNVWRDYRIEVISYGGNPLPE